MLPYQICVLFFFFVLFLFVSFFFPFLFNVYPDDSIVILMFTLRQTNNELNELLLNYATFYKVSHRAVITIIIIIIDINLHRSNWLFIMSVLEVKVSDWVTSRTPLVL